MTKRSKMRLGWFCLALFAADMLVTGPGARAQNVNNLTRPQLMPPEHDTRKPTPAPAVPGARSSDNEPAPAERSPNDMQPTDALFDAINRGDIATVRDAVARGADLDAQNILGLTPLALSVDLGRHDISFLLLSLRGPQPDAIAGGAPGAPLLPGKAAARQVKITGPRPTGSSHGTVIVAVAPKKPLLFAANGGTPVPAAGFLGFGGAH